jgi:hypothetical protein
MTANWTTIIAALITAVIGGIGVAGITYLLNRKRVAAETAKLAAETDKIRVEIRALTTTVASLPQPTKSYVFDGRGRIEGFDVSYKEAPVSDAYGKPVSPIARGTILFEDGGILNVQRSNTDGRFQLFLKHYVFGGKSYGYIPRDETIAGKRNLLVECDAKAIGADHVLRFVVKDPKGGGWLAKFETTVSGNSWRHLAGLLEFDAAVDAVLRIDDEGVTRAPSSVQISNLVVMERREAL